MDDNQIRQLFAAFDPPLGDDAEFMARLRRSVQAAEAERTRQRREAVATLRSEHAAVCRRTRRAVAIAAAAGFLVGSLFSLALPHIGQSVASLLGTLLATDLAVAADGSRLVAWLVVAAAATAAAVSAYDLALALDRPRR